MRRTLAASALVIGTIAVAAAQSRPVTIDDVLDLKVVGSPAVSPDGSRVLYTVRQWEASSERERDRRDARTRIWMVSAAGGDARPITFGERGDSQPQWSPDGTYIGFVSARGAATGDEPPKPQVYLMASRGGEARKLTDAPEGVSAYSWSPDSRRIAYVSTDPRSSEEEATLKKRDDERVFEDDFRYAHVWAIDVSTKPATRVTGGRDFTVSGAPSWAPDGSRLTFAAGVTPMLRDARRDVYVADVAGGGVTRISTNPGSDANPRWSPDGRWIAWTAEPNTGAPIGDGTLPGAIVHGRLTLYDTSAKTIRDASSPAFDLEPGTPAWSPDSARLLFTAGRRAYTDVFSYDLATGRYQPLTERRTLQFGSQSRDGRVVAVVMDSPGAPGEVHVSDASFTSFRRLTETNPQAAGFALGATEVITWKSTDGLEIEGVLLKPVGYQEGRRYPLLVVAHGGPSGAFVNSYRVGGLEGGQLWAGQGWAVFYPNPRGSTNYGEKFMRANINDWGGGDYRDIMSGVDALVARGIADPDRLAHIGWSYGGYMTAWVVSQTPRFKAAMVGAGLTNMWSMYGTNDIPNVLIGYFGGIVNPKTLPLYMERSAMTHIDKVVTPTLILHGGNDERVPVGQALELYRGLKDRGKIAELVFYPREGHGISEYYHLKDRLTRIQDWVTRHTLGDGGRKTTSQ
jgi:dipeptidyl aminopeptidase/acylaminoacyl peptidase